MAVKLNHIETREVASPHSALHFADYFLTDLAWRKPFCRLHLSFLGQVEELIRVNLAFSHRRARMDMCKTGKVNLNHEN
jgi:hypothetical protein